MTSLQRRALLNPSLYVRSNVHFCLNYDFIKSLICDEMYNQLDAIISLFETGKSFLKWVMNKRSKALEFPVLIPGYFEDIDLEFQIYGRTSAIRFSSVEYFITLYKLRLIHIKFNILFSRFSQKTSKGFLEIKELISIALKKDYVKIFQILVHYINLTKLECEKVLKETKFSLIKKPFF
ncbi:hypothetical protein DICPUDRAFT_82943 [Dictyostelium purpureum]|uniref:Uncharacterized protein n=1 Tax=Dictyostelium purpureum TaxID=5786 RepID=F0ZY32_DICPU|nr:uncharacterized protein DICPUDRAFT_82943 [Dictyostelium purpureum]EGC31143.1 hypothetical protein DICPUDRAFT_82943 [Dictyostelium purpureum]|eukprot:XP_003292331.1 hypothetical protein DICPUDRAFT_82943 [Dictyostelium purpureum]